MESTDFSPDWASSPVRLSSSSSSSSHFSVLRHDRAEEVLANGAEKVGERGELPSRLFGLLGAGGVGATRTSSTGELPGDLRRR